MDITYRPTFHPEFEELMERIHPPRVCIDNDACPNCTLVKVDSANKNGMLLEIVQALSDLDLVISKSYISSDGGWLMDVFHVTDQKGKKIADKSILQHIQEDICTSRKASKDVKPRNVDEETRPPQECMGHTALEMTGIDRPGLMSEMSAVLAELGCNVSSVMAWTHNSRAACIIHLDTSEKDPSSAIFHVDQVKAQLENVVDAHHYKDEKHSLRLAVPTTCPTHTERRLHQLLAADKDYDECCSCCSCKGDDDKRYPYVIERYPIGEGAGKCEKTHVKIGKCRENGYSVISISCRDRPKLLFDTLCTLTDLHYVVFHAAMSSKGTVSFQEYYVRHENGCTLDSEGERQSVTRCLIAAMERRTSEGLKLEINTRNRTGLLSDITRIFRENGLSITRAEIGLRGSKAVGTFCVKDMSGEKVNLETINTVIQQIGGTVLIENECLEASNDLKSYEKHQLSFGNFLKEQFERFSGNIRSIKSRNSLLAAD